MNSLRLLLGVLLVSTASAQVSSAFAPAVRPRVVVLTDISNEPDDEESLVRFLVYSNEYDVEGLVATTSTWLKKTTREDLIRRQIAAYAEVRGNLSRHAQGYPAPEQLESVAFTGQPGYGMPFVGPEHSTPGSKHIVRVMESTDPRPLWITVWGGANTLAQALIEFRAKHTAEELGAALSKVWVYSISDQDDAGAWIRREFPELSYIVSPSRQDEKEYWRATWTGISGDRLYKNGPMHKFALVDNPWLLENVRSNHGQLGALYPKFVYIMEGDTPSFIGLVPNGLGWDASPSFGGWGGRYVLYQATGESRRIWTNNADSRDTVTADNGHTETSDMATIWRWREHFQNDFAARMDWCAADAYGKANHNPRPVLNGDVTKAVLTLKAKAGTELELSADGTRDPDGNGVRLTWWIYEEAGTFKGASLGTAEGTRTTVRLPAAPRPGTLHVILQAQDDGEPSLFAYRRAVIDVTP